MQFFLVFLSAVWGDNFSSFLEHNAQFKPTESATIGRSSMMLVTNVWHQLLRRSEGEVQKLVTTEVFLLETLQSPRVEHLRSITTPHEVWQKF